MSKRSYDTSLSLAEGFRQLTGAGNPPDKAIERLAELYHAFHFCLVRPLPDLLFSLGAANELVVTLADGRQLDPGKIRIRKPGLLDPVPIPLARYRMMCADPKQTERDALAAVTIDRPQPPSPPEAVPVIDPPPPPWPGTAPGKVEPRKKKTAKKPEPKGRRKVEEKPKAERKLLTRYMSWESQTWLKIIPHLQTLELPDLNAAFRAVVAWLDAKGLTMSRSAIYDGLKRHRADWE